MMPPEVWDTFPEGFWAGMDFKEHWKRQHENRAWMAHEWLGGGDFLMKAMAYPVF